MTPTLVKAAKIVAASYGAKAKASKGSIDGIISLNNAASNPKASNFSELGIGPRCRPKSLLGATTKSISSKRSLRASDRIWTDGPAGDSSARVICRLEYRASRRLRASAGRGYPSPSGGGETPTE